LRDKKREGSVILHISPSLMCHALGCLIQREGISFCIL
jgi:hypothetical protein